MEDRTRPPAAARGLALTAGFAPRFVITSDSAYLNGTFQTGFIGHDLTIGTAGYKSETYSVITAASAASVAVRMAPSG